MKYRTRSRRRTRKQTTSRRAIHKRPDVGDCRGPVPSIIVLRFNKPVRSYACLPPYRASRHVLPTRAGRIAPPSVPGAHLENRTGSSLTDRPRYRLTVVVKTAVGRCGGGGVRAVYPAVVIRDRVESATSSRVASPYEEKSRRARIGTFAKRPQDRRIGSRTRHFIGKKRLRAIRNTHGRRVGSRRIIKKSRISLTRSPFASSRKYLPGRVGTVNRKGGATRTRISPGLPDRGSAGPTGNGLRDRRDSRGTTGGHAKRVSESKFSPYVVLRKIVRGTVRRV